MKHTTYLQPQKRLSGNRFSENEGTQLDTGQLLGTWINTNKDTRNIARIILAHRDNNLYLRVFGARGCEPGDWGEVLVTELFAEATDSHAAISFTAEYDFGFLQTELQTNLNLGLLIITSLNTFTDKIAKSNHFSREYFYKEPTSGCQV